MTNGEGKVPAPTETHAQTEAIEREIDELIAEFGDAGAALRAVLHDLGEVIADRNKSVSAGYVRNTVVRMRRRKQ